MKRLYGYIDSDGEIYAADEICELDKLELVSNPTWEMDDYTDEQGNHWIRVDRLAALFDDLCKSTGMTKKALSAYCGVTPQSFNNYISGKHPVPIAIWRMVEERKLK